MNNFRWVGLSLLIGLGVALVLAGAACGPKATPTADSSLTTAPAPKVPEGPPLFRDITATSKIDWTYTNGQEAKNLAILESLGGGIGLIDYDGDGLLDVFVVGGGYFEGKEIRGHPCKLYRNLGNGTFEDVTKDVGLDKLAMGQPWFFTHGVAVGDYNRDGWPDLLVTGWGHLALFQNVPVDPANPAKGRKFVDATEQAKFGPITWASSAGWADFDGDGFPDLYVCQYANWSFDNHPACHYDPKVPDVCPPKQFSGLQHKIYRNNGDGSFTDMTDKVGLKKGGPDASKGLGVLLVDVNGDGKPDIFVANDTVDKFLYINKCTPGNFEFEEVALQAGVARDDHGTPNGSMGVDAADIDGSGLPWLWCTNYENELHGLYKNLGKSGPVSYRYATQASGIAAIGQKYVAWGTGFFDIDHHGWEDLFIANGHAIHYPVADNGDARQRPVLMRNEGGKFKDITARGGSYFEQKHRARGAALGDLNNDGKIDIVISHVNEPVAILENVAETANHWLGVQLVGKKNADVVGARVVLETNGRKQTRFAKGGGSYASSGDRRHVFGLGKADRAGKLTVIWPSGQKQEWNDLAIDKYHRLEQQ